MAAVAPQFGGEAVDVRHDLARQRDLALMPGFDEIVLHVDDQERGAWRVDGVERMQLADPRPHPRQGTLRDRDFVHVFLVRGGVWGSRDVRCALSSRTLGFFTRPWRA